MIRLVVALDAEARPLVDRLALSRLEDRRTFPVYASEHAERALVVSGVGPERAAAATAYLHAVTGEARLSAWLNVGIAGHPSASIGKLYRAHSVVDGSSGAKHYLPRVGALELPLAPVTTVRTPETRFPDDSLYDMEAFAFVEMALALSTAELVQSIKIVSDNRASGTQSVNGTTVKELIGSHVDTVAELAAHLEALAEELSPLRSAPAAVEAFTRRWRFTKTERRKLEKLLSSWASLGRSPSPEELASVASASSALARLEEELQEAVRAKRGYS